MAASGPPVQAVDVADAIRAAREALASTETDDRALHRPPPRGRSRLPQRPVRDKPPEASVFIDCSQCDECWEWIGWGRHPKCGWAVPLDVQPHPGGDFILLRDNITAIARGVRSTDEPELTSRRYRRHDCGRPAQPRRVMSKATYRDPTLDLRMSAQVDRERDR